ncbi:MAG: MMPL family transporter [Bacteroidales bacterium]|jgi:predicted RND superfamily exporter protein|nr:MMPL family transporter [Bacteroidales bacterium]
MWIGIARFILRYRIALLVVFAGLTAFMAFQARKVHLSYEYAALLPQTDTALQEHQAFKKIFGEDANSLIVGLQSETFFKLNQFNAFLDMCDTLRTLPGVEGVLSVGSALKLEGTTIVPYFANRPQTQADLDSTARDIRQQKLYEGLMFTDSSDVYALMITIKQEVLDCPEREVLIADIQSIVTNFAHTYNVQTHFTGMPYIRTKVSLKLQNELVMFILLAALVCAIIIFLFFRSLKIVFFSMLTVGIGVVFTMGIMGMLGYSISILNAMLPPLIIVIAVPNCVFFLNKYHIEYARHGNQIKALQRVIVKIGNAIFIANLITAISFGAFIVTDSILLIEFGIVASLGILAAFVASLVLIPVIFSFLAPPNPRNLKHLDAKFINLLVKHIINIVSNHRPKVYIATGVVVVVAAIGITRLQTTGFMVDDLPQHDTLMVDLKFMENQFDGALPMEFMIEMPDKINFMRDKDFMRRLDVFQEKLASHPELSKPLSIIDVIKFSWQAHNHGDPEYYSLPNSMDIGYQNKMKKIVRSQNGSGLAMAMIDSTGAKIRVKANVQDIGTQRMEALEKAIMNDILEVWGDSTYQVKKIGTSMVFTQKDETGTVSETDFVYKITMTGASVVFSKGTKYIRNSLFTSIGLAFVIIAFIMLWLFRSKRMVGIALLVNILPQLITAALMGYLGIPIKPSTVLVFSIAFGNVTDDTIHFLARYRQELKHTNWDIGKSVLITIRETNPSMIYTSLILFFGFGIFVFSQFGGTQALGALVSITVFMAMISNNLLLPSLLLSLEQRMTKKSFGEPLLLIYDEEEDIDLSELQIAESTSDTNTTNNENA